MGDLNWNKEAQREQLYEGLSDEINMPWSPPVPDPIVWVI